MENYLLFDKQTKVFSTVPEILNCSLNLSLKIEPVTVGADATVYSTGFSVNKSQPWQARFSCGETQYFLPSLGTKLSFPCVFTKSKYALFFHSIQYTFYVSLLCSFFVFISRVQQMWIKENLRNSFDSFLCTKILSAIIPTQCHFPLDKLGKSLEFILRTAAL